MELSCPHIIWRIAPFSLSKHCFTDSFKFGGCYWQWEYIVQFDNDDDVPDDDIVSIYLRRLTNSSVCSLKTFCTIASIRDSLGEQHAMRIENHEISPLASWCVWKKSKSYIYAHDVIENNGCSFSLTLEPLYHVESMKSLKEKDYDVSCLQELSRDFDNSFNCPRHADIILRCGNTEIKAHKDVLCFRSKTFSDMIGVEDNLEKTLPENLNSLTLEYMDPVVFVSLVRYIYTATLPDLTNELAKKMYEAADVYSVESLKKICVKFIIQHLSSFDALKYLLFANEHNDDDMKWAVSSYIASDMNILNSDEWETFSNDNQKMAIEVFKLFTERVNSRESSELLYSV